MLLPLFQRCKNVVRLLLSKVLQNNKKFDIGCDFAAKILTIEIRYHSLNV
jgi:hypothetical protein